jgi:atypical dual specificity phosphatase
MLFVIIWSVFIYVFCVFFHYDIAELESVKQLKYAVTLPYERMTKKEWFHRIEPTRHYLGAQPQSDFNHVHLFKELKIDVILMILEEFEENGGWFYRHLVVNQDEWHDISVNKIRAIDGRPLKFTHIDSGVKILQEATLRNQSVYVHCKAGHGRSAAIFWAYLTLAYHMDPMDALDLLIKQRPAVNLNRHQRAAVLDYILHTRGCFIDKH